jgi:hypothetical protein
MDSKLDSETSHAAKKLKKLSSSTSFSITLSLPVFLFFYFFFIILTVRFFFSFQSISQPSAFIGVSSSFIIIVYVRVVLEKNSFSLNVKTNYIFSESSFLENSICFKDFKAGSSFSFTSDAIISQFLNTLSQYSGIGPESAVFAIKSSFYYFSDSFK